MTITSKINLKYLLLTSIAGLLLFTGSGCDVTGVQESEEMGVIRVMLRANPADSTITIGGDRVVADSTDEFRISVFQGRMSKDSVFSLLFNDLYGYEQEERLYNVFERNTEGEMKEFRIFHTYLPPGQYQSLEFGLTAEQVNIDDFTIPVDLPPDSSTLYRQRFEEPVTISSNDTTVIRLQFSPFESIQRYGDEFRLYRDISVENIEYQK